MTFRWTVEPEEIFENRQCKTYHADFNIDLKQFSILEGG